jgi:hypothetical protein
LDDSTAIRQQSTKSNLEQDLKENIMNSFKPIWISLAAMVVLSLASCNTTPPIPEGNPISSGGTVETRAGKTSIAHYDKWGNLTFILHWLDPGLYSYIINYLLASGQDPSPENIDRVYDAMKH